MKSINTDILRKYNKPGPRYTSYPPATFFHQGVNNESYVKMISRSNHQQPHNISLYIHIPFCKQLCNFCGCNTGRYPGDDFVERYIDALINEINRVADLIDLSRPLTQVHWGGGTPNAIKLEYVEKVMQQIFSRFTPAPNAEIAMECNPAYLQPEHIDTLARLGFNRLSLGIQDFDHSILKLVNREPSALPVETLIERMKENNMKGVNIDLIYGLPGQTKESFRQTILKAIEIAPDRLVTFSYAHVPWVKSAQKLLEKIGLPEADQKLQMFETAYQLLTSHGYVAIGMDHYARPEDELAVALDNKKLHRNFQGYCTRETTGQVYGFGASSISQLYGGYYQNHKDPSQYIEAINTHGLAIDRGYEHTYHDIIRRTVINEIMCNGFLQFSQIAANFDISVKELKEITGYETGKLQSFVDDGLLHLDDDTISLQENGFLVVRNIAMEFDPLLKQDTNQYSRTV